MKLLCVTGPYRDKTYSLQPPGISLGRELDNDIALDDGEASRYHAKVTQVDGIWYIEDNGSTNGVYHNGAKIDRRAPLSLNDTFRIGSIEFRLVDDQHEPTVAPADGATPSAEPAKSTRSKLPTIVLAVLLAVLVIIVGAVLLVPAAPPAAGTSEVSVEAQPLAFFYERTEVSPGTVFRYQLALEDKQLEVQVDDAVNQTRVEEVLELDDDQLQVLKSALLTDEFLAAKAPPAERQREREIRARLMVRAGPIGNYLAVDNAVAPPAFEDVVAHLTQFIQSEVGVIAESLPREEIISRARDYYQQGRQLQADATVDNGNLHQALLAYRHVIERLKWLDNKPDFYQQAVQEYQAISEVLDERLARLEREAITYRNTGQLQEARERYMAIVSSVPDRDNEYVRRARREVVRIDEELKKLRRNR